MMTESAMFIRKLVKDTFKLIYKVSRLIKKKLRRYVTVSMRWELICMVLNLLPGNSSEADDLHQGSGQVEQHIPQTVHCLPQDARLRKKNSDYWVKRNWTWSNLNSSGPISPCDTCKRHCLDNTFCFDSNFKFFNKERW